VNAEFQFDATDVELVVNKQLTAFIIRAETIDQPPTGPQRSGKHIHLTITTKQALRLLSMLEAARQKLGLHREPPASALTVPPAKDRN
jgi:hypothetical protein